MTEQSFLAAVDRLASEHAATLDLAERHMNEKLALMKAVLHVIETFERDEAQGFRSKDRQFAISILRSALDEAR